MVKVILQLYPVIPASSEEEREALRPIGRNRERYQETIQGWSDIVRAADEMGLWGVSSIEHHFWSEGYECGPCPGILNAYWASFTKNVRVGQMGYVMSSQNPIRVAEETAVLDHLTQGRFFVGFARGYQSRWTNVLGQHLGTRATLSPSAAKVDPDHLFGSTANQKDRNDDETNRRIFEEEIDIVVKAWTQDSIEFNGRAWKIPYPYDTGVDDWPPAKMGITQRFGAPGEVDADGNIRRVSVVPAPYTRPHPPVFVATSGSPESAEYAARRGFIPLYFTSLKTALALGRVYHSAAAEAGSSLPFGGNQALVRMPHIASSRTKAEDALVRCDGDIFRNFYSAMSRKTVGPSDVVSAIAKTGLWTIGTAEEVRAQFIEEWKQFPCEYVTLIYHYAQMPKDEVIDNLEAFMRHVKPALDELTEYTPAMNAQTAAK
jgi:alkanesulfonate monooxygenase SsuD/methylene tetrahydromethanopterin reductase-like flavin-dependent oxidoreductase (luciferase family)